jgi:hypothetical protein
MSYPNLLNPKKYKDPNTGKEGAPMYNFEMIMTPEDVENFEVLKESGEWDQINVSHAMAEVARKTWPDIDLKEEVKYRSLRWPLKDGNQKKAEREAKGKKGDVYEGMKIIPVKASEKWPPQLYVVENGKFRELSRSDDADRKTIDDLFVAGYYVRANVNVTTAFLNEIKYVTFWVNAVVFIRKGDRIGGMTAEQRFGGVEGGESDYDPTEGLDDEIPF